MLSSLRVSVCERERERERESERDAACCPPSGRPTPGGGQPLARRARDIQTARKRERVSGRERASERVCERERESMCVCVCVCVWRRESEIPHGVLLPPALLLAKGSL